MREGNGKISPQRAKRGKERTRRAEWGGDFHVWQSRKGMQHFEKTRLDNIREMPQDECLFVIDT